jgi:hypothetical protein
MQLIDIFFSPGKLFEAMREKASFVSPIVAVTLLSIVTFAIFANLIGIEAIARTQLENSSNRMTANLTEEQKENAIRQAGSPVRLAMDYGGIAVGTPISLLIVAGALLGVLSLAGGKLKFGQVLGVTAFAAVPFALLGLVMSLAVILASPDRESLDITNLIATNIGAFLNKDTTNKALYSVAVSTDLITLAHVAFLGWGLSKASRVSFTTCTVLVIALWSMLVLAKAGLALLF